MTTQAQWSGQPVLVTSTLVPRLLWQSASIDVFIDDVCVLRTGGQYKFTGSHTSHFTRSGRQHEVVLKWGLARFRSFPIELTIDGERVLESRVYTSNWYLNLWPLVVILLFVYLANR